MNEIIIDDVNVAECEFYQIAANELYPKAQYCGSMRNTFCENEPNCYFKQLQRAKAENEKLKQTLEEVKNYCNECNLKADYTACEVLKIIDEVLDERR